MSHLPQRWLGVILRVVRVHYPDARLAAWGAMVDEGPDSARPGDRLELVILDPPNPTPATLSSIRSELEASDLPVETDLRPLTDLTMTEQEEVLQRGEQFGG